MSWKAELLSRRLSALDVLVIGTSVEIGHTHFFWGLVVLLGGTFVTTWLREKNGYI